MISSWKTFSVAFFLLAFHGALFAAPWSIEDKELDTYLPRLASHLFVVGQSDGHSGCYFYNYFADNEHLSAQDKSNLRLLVLAIEDEGGNRLYTWGDKPFTHEQFRKLVDDRFNETQRTLIEPGRTLSGLSADASYASWAGADIIKAVRDWTRLRAIHTPEGESEWAKSEDKLWKLLYERFGAGYVVVTKCDPD